MSNFPAYIERMVDEHTQLNTKKNALVDFVRTDKFENELSQTQKNLMYDQLTAMTKYANILDARIVLEKRLHNAS